MRYFSTLLISLFIFSCGTETEHDTKKEIISTWPNGKAKVEHVYLRADTIKVINYNISGRIKTEGKMFGEIREGKWTSYYPSGKKWSLNNFKGGEKHGEYKTWHPNEQLNISGFYSMGASTGEWMFYDSTGVLTKQYDVTPQH
jgi:antitoxin component YwqK of YwqJK toxin-antitoxin module